MNFRTRLKRLEQRRQSLPPWLAPPIPARRPPTLAEFNRALDELAENLDGEPELSERLARARVALANEGATPRRATLRTIKRICGDVERLDADAVDDWR